MNCGDLYRFFLKNLKIYSLNDSEDEENNGDFQYVKIYRGFLLPTFEENSGRNPLRMVGEISVKI